MKVLLDTHTFLWWITGCCTLQMRINLEPYMVEAVHGAVVL
jgi:PIN domain nuclease of toxin-antitoxin system